MRGVPALVVLSACDAAAEPAGAADGRMNLVRAFLAAGAHDVVASLWETSDASTVELMTHFYEELMQRGLEPEAALAGAQAQLASAGRWRAPFYWAGFVVTRAVP
jgi:CHAT domain-containing protein